MSNKQNKIKILEEEIKNMISSDILSETVPEPEPKTEPNPEPEQPVRRRRRKVRREEIAPWFTREVGHDPKRVVTTTERIQQIMSELRSFKDTPLENSSRASMLKKELEQLSGTGIWAKTKFFCRNSPKICIFLGISTAVLAYFGIKKIGEQFHVFPPSPKPVKPPKPQRGGGGGSYASCATVLKYGCRGENVKTLQQKLLDCGYELPRKGVDGFFGPETKSAVMSLQKDNGLSVDGVAGPKTMQALENCGSSTKPTKPVEAETSITPDVMGTRKFTPDPVVLQGKETEGTATKDYGETNEHLVKRTQMLEKLVFERLVKNAN